MHDPEKLKFPIGVFTEPSHISDMDVDGYIQTIRNFPASLEHVVAAWSPDQLDTQYRPGGWTVRQLVNHLADSHMNSYIRFKLALTEEHPTVKPYREAAWAELQDSITIDIKPSLLILKGLHARWVYELRALTNREFDECSFYHPEQERSIHLRLSLAYYAWHCKHHLAHITNLKLAKGW